MGFEQCFQLRQHCRARSSLQRRRRASDRPDALEIGQRIGDRLCAHLSSEYRARQTDPTRIALLDDRMLREAGGDFWRLEDLDEGSPFWPYRLDAVLARVRADGRQARPAL